MDEHSKQAAHHHGEHTQNPQNTGADDAHVGHAPDAGEHGGHPPDAEEHGGRIWVESVRGEGSTFSFTLPKGLVQGATERAGTAV